MSLLVKAKSGRTIVEVTPASANWKYVGFVAYRLKAGESLTVQVPGCETCTVVLSGRVTARTAEHAWTDIGKRESVFDDSAPFAIYAPAPERVEITAHTDAEIGVASAPAGTEHEARLIEPGTMKRSVPAGALATPISASVWAVISTRSGAGA